MEEFKRIIYQPGTITRITLNRPEVRNAFDDQMIEELHHAAWLCDKDDQCRVVILSGGDGKVFSAGADINWMRSVIDYSWEENVRDSERLARMLDMIWKNRKPFICRVNGHAIGGGCGLVAVCDVAVALTRAKFGFTEVKLGIAPAVISPYVLRKIGFSHARRFFLTGELFDAYEAQYIGLVHILADTIEDMDLEVNRLAQELLTSSPNAIAHTKELVRSAWLMGGEQVLRYTVGKIAELRVSQQGQEGLRAFLEKREPEWVKELPEELRPKGESK